MARVNRPKMDADGLGWLVDYVARLVHWYPSFTRDFVMDELPMAEGWIWFSAAYLDDPMHKFSGVKLKGGYIAQERDELVKIANQLWGKPN